MVWEDVPEGEKLFSTATGFNTDNKGGSVHAMQYWVAQARKRIIEKRLKIIKGEIDKETGLTNEETKKSIDSE